jgi:ElaA protein
MDVNWIRLKFKQLSLEQLYDIMVLRQKVFVVEQTCPYQDADGVDRHTYHLMGYQQQEGRNELVAYCRIVPPGLKYEEASIGRVVTAGSVRGRGIGKVLILQAIDWSGALFPNIDLRISAQQYLEKFYEDFGFCTVSDPYLEDDIPHIEMRRSYNATI